MTCCHGSLAKRGGVSYIADMDADNPLRSLQAASCTYRIALGPRAGQKVLSLRTVVRRDEKTTRALCVDAHGFSLHGGVRCGAHQRKALEREVAQLLAEKKVLLAATIIPAEVSLSTLYSSANLRPSSGVV